MPVGLAIEGRLAEAGDPAVRRAMVAGWLRRARVVSLTGEVEEADGEWPVLLARLHAGAEPVELSFPDDRAVRLATTTDEIGPGYHQHVCEVAGFLGRALGIGWRETEEAFDDSGYFATRDRAALEGRMLDALRARAEAGEWTLGGEFEPVGVDGAATLLGPRSREWISRVASDPRAGVEALPWWDVGRTGPVLAREAKVLMWRDVRWREPDSAEESALLVRVGDLLEGARQLGAEEEIPWRAWDELIGLGAAADPDVRAIVRERAEHAPADGQPIGYRRGEIARRVEGWEVVIPGLFAEYVERHDAGESWIAHGDRRYVRLAFEAHADEAGHAAALPALRAAFASPPGRAIESRVEEPDRFGECWRVETGEVETPHALQGYVMRDGGVALATIGYGGAWGWGWAEGCWRSLR